MDIVEIIKHAGIFGVIVITFLVVGLYLASYMHSEDSELAKKSLFFAVVLLALLGGMILTYTLAQVFIGL